VLRLRWDHLDWFLCEGFDVPWPPGAILRVPGAAQPLSVVVVKVATTGGQPLVVVELLDGPDVSRTADTARIIQARVVDPRARRSLADLQRRLGVGGPDERVPLRVALHGYAPAGVELVGTRKVRSVDSGDSIIDWSDLAAFADRLRASSAVPVSVFRPAGEGV
jgi:hypothetical protein